MAKQNSFFYRIDSGPFLAAVVSVPAQERGEWVLGLALALVNGDSSHSDFAAKAISEATEFSAKKKDAAHKRWIAQRMRIDALHMQEDAQHMQSNARSSNSNIEPKVKDSSPPADFFSQFWSAYPKKTGKGEAEKAWKKIKSPSATLDLILEALKWQVESHQWKDGNGKYIPNPSTYLNQRRWEDEPKNKASDDEDWRRYGQ